MGTSAERADEGSLDAEVNRDIDNSSVLSSITPSADIDLEFETCDIELRCDGDGAVWSDDEYWACVEDSTLEAELHRRNQFASNVAQLEPVKYSKVSKNLTDRKSDRRRSHSSSHQVEDPFREIRLPDSWTDKAVQRYIIEDYIDSLEELEKDLGLTASPHGLVPSSKRHKTERGIDKSKEKRRRHSKLHSSLHAVPKASSCTHPPSPCRLPPSVKTGTRSARSPRAGKYPARSEHVVTRRPATPSAMPRRAPLLQTPRASHTKRPRVRVSARVPTENV